MKATLQYNLPKEAYVYNCAHNGWRYRSELRDLQEQLRSWRKHGHSFADADAVIENIWSRFVVDGVDVED